MNRSDLIHELANRFSEIEKTDTELAVRLIFDEMANALINGRRIEIRNFGVLQARTRPSTTYRNPRTGEKLSRRSTRSIRFKVGKNLRRRLAGGNLLELVSLES
jgi:integration host factor subunit beta